MKRAYLILIRILTIFLPAIILLSACKTELKSTAEECTECKSNVDEQTTISLVDGEHSYPLPGNLWYADGFLKNYDYADFNNIDENQYHQIQALLTDLTKQTTPKNQILGYAIYLNKQLRGTHSFSSTDIIGVSVYHLEAQNLLHEIFLRNKTNNTFYSVENLKAQTDGVSITMIHDMLKYVLRPGTSGASSLLAMDPEKNTALKDVKKVDFLKRSLGINYM